MKAVIIVDIQSRNKTNLADGYENRVLMNLESHLNDIRQIIIDENDDNNIPVQVNVADAWTVKE